MAPRKRTKNNRRKVMKTLVGRKFQPSPHPPDFTSRPWFPLTLRIEAPGASLTTVDIANALSTQLGFSVSGQFLNIRLFSIRAWASLNAGGNLNPLNCVILDVFQTITSSNARVLEQITSYPDAVNRACIGYKYDKTHSDLSIFMGTATPVSVANFTNMGANSVVYLQILWRCFDVLPTLLDTDWDDLPSISSKCTCKH
jgi:hypothetical protein